MLQNCYETLAIIALANLCLSGIVLFIFLASPLEEPNWIKWPTLLTLTLWPVIAVAFVILKIVEVWI